NQNLKAGQNIWDSDVDGCPIGDSPELPRLIILLLMTQSSSDGVIAPTQQKTAKRFYRLLLMVKVLSELPMNQAFGSRLIISNMISFSRGHPCLRSVKGKLPNLGLFSSLPS